VAFSMFIIAVIVLIASKPPAKHWHSFLRIVAAAAQGTPGTGVVRSGFPSPNATLSPRRGPDLVRVCSRH
jgi:hypothetical protein